MPQKILDQLKREQDPHRRRLLLVGYLCSALNHLGLTPVLVGGNAAEFYTYNDYTTHDIDIVTPYRAEVGTLLEAIGFTKEGGFRWC